MPLRQRAIFQRHIARTGCTLRCHEVNYRTDVGAHVEHLKCAPGRDDDCTALRLVDHRGREAKLLAYRGEIALREVNASVDIRIAHRLIVEPRLLRLLQKSRFVPHHPGAERFRLVRRKYVPHARWLLLVGFRCVRRWIKRRFGRLALFRNSVHDNGTEVRYAER